MRASLPRRFATLLWRRKWLTLAAVGGFILALTPIIILTRTYAILHPDLHPTARPGAYVLEEQTESFTCGLHALSTLYHAYGLDPESERLRWRLGVDTKAVFWLPDSTGALHPDIMMVLAQDHFEARALDLDSATAWADLQAHLDAGHPALVLFRRRQTGNLHWATITRREGAAIVCFDSLAPAPYREGADFLSTRVASIILVRPTVPGDAARSSLAAHAAGVRETERALARLRKLGEATP